MNEKILNNLIAERAKVTDKVRKMVEDGVKPEQQEEYDKYMTDFNNLTKQIDDLKTMDAIEDKVEEIAKPVDSKKAFENFIRFGDASMIHNSVTTGTSSAGYLVPEELRRQIVQIMYEAGEMMNIADVIVSSTLTDIPVDGTAPTAYWIAEEGVFIDSSPTVGRI